MAFTNVFPKLLQFLTFIGQFVVYCEDVQFFEHHTFHVSKDYSDCNKRPVPCLSTPCAAFKAALAPGPLFYVSSTKTGLSALTTQESPFS